MRSWEMLGVALKRSPDVVPRNAIPKYHKTMKEPSAVLKIKTSQYVTADQAVTSRYLPTSCEDAGRIAIC